MSLSIPIRPNIVSNTGGNRPRKYHTIHLNDNHVFTVQHNGISVLSFRNLKDVYRFSKLIESHYDLTQEWPLINFEDTLLFRNTKIERLKYVDIQEWSEDILTMWCIQNAFSMLDIYQFEDDNKLIGRSIYWETDSELYKNILNEKFIL